MKLACPLPSPSKVAPNSSLLIARVLAGDPQAERALYAAYVDRTYRLALRMTGDDEVAREATQQTFIRVFRWLHTFRGESSFATWLHRVAVNVTSGELRHVTRSRERELGLDAVAPIASSFHEPDPMLRQRLQDALGSLPEIYRVVVLMHDLDGFTHDQISEALEIPSGTSKARLSRARARLRPLLTRCALEYAS